MPSLFTMAFKVVRCKPRRGTAPQLPSPRFRVSNSMKNRAIKRCSPRRVHISTVKNSAATITSQCRVKNSLAGGGRRWDRKQRLRDGESFIPAPSGADRTLGEAFFLKMVVRTSEKCIISRFSCWPQPTELRATVPFGYVIAHELCPLLLGGRPWLQPLLALATTRSQRS
jgi:hypothetical protein